MPEPTFRQIFTSLARLRRRVVATVSNAVRPSGGRQGLRIFSDVGFRSDVAVTYLVPASAHVTEASEPRAITTVNLHVYGVDYDRRGLVAPGPEARRVFTAPEDGRVGAAGLPGFASYVVHADQAPSTVSAERTRRLVLAVTSAQTGPAYHAVVTRSGAVVFAVPLDDVVHADPATAEASYDIAVEGALALGRTEQRSGNHDHFLELPLTPLQLDSLAVLLAKLKAAQPGLSLTFGETGLRYRFPTLTGAEPYNFTSRGWTDRLGSPFDHTDSDVDGLLARIAGVGSFDLATEVFRPSGAPDPGPSLRELARTAMGSRDTLGAASPRMALYATLAGEERAEDMRTASRSRVFIQRAQAAHAEAEAHDGDAATATAADALDDDAPPQVVNASVNAYNFVTGFWGDGTPF
jgi:hypothetical protein